jgi:hypothetical protein
MAKANADLEVAVARYAKNGGAQSIEALRLFLENAGVVPDVIQEIIDQILKLNNTPVTTTFPVAPRKGGTGFVDPGGNFQVFHQGGVVQGTPGTDQLVITQAGEEIGRRSEAGNGGSGGGGFLPIHIDVSGRTLATAMVPFETIRKRYSPR